MSKIHSYEHLSVVITPRCQNPTLFFFPAFQTPQKTVTHTISRHRVWSQTIELELAWGCEREIFSLWGLLHPRDTSQDQTFNGMKKATLEREKEREREREREREFLQPPRFSTSSLFSFSLRSVTKKKKNQLLKC